MPCMAFVFMKRALAGEQVERSKLEIVDRVHRPAILALRDKGGTDKGGTDGTLPLQ
jgi:hypothetical protein